MAQESTGDVVKRLIFIIVVFEIVCLLLGFCLGIISSIMDHKDLCFKRYYFDSLSKNGAGIGTSLNIRADGKYASNIKETTAANGAFTGTTEEIVNTEYGQWKRANINISANQELEIRVSGEMSLCRSYLPRYHLQDVTLPANNGELYYKKPVTNQRIPIPRVEENKEPLTLIFDARTDGWRNLAEVFNGDIVKVILNDDARPGLFSLQDQTNIPVTVSDCNTLSDQSPQDDCITAGGDPASCNLLSERSPRESCLIGLRSGARSLYDPNDCAAIGDRNLREACETQFNTPPGPSGMTEDQCRRLPPSMVAGCIANIPTAPAPTLPTTNPVPSPAASTSPAPLTSAPTAAIDPCASFTGFTLTLCRQANPPPTSPSVCSCSGNYTRTNVPCNELYPDQCVDQCINWVDDMDLCRDANPAPVDGSPDPCDMYSGDLLTLCRQANPIPTGSGPASCPCGTNVGTSSVPCKDQFPDQCFDNCNDWTDASEVYNWDNWASSIDLCRQANPAPPAPAQASTPFMYTITDSISEIPKTADCGEGLREYDPICGRYSLWNNTTNYYPESKCHCRPRQFVNHGFLPRRCLRYVSGQHSHCWASSLFGCSFGTIHNHHSYAPCYECYPTRAPEPYLFDQSRSKSRFTNQTLWLIHDYTSNPQGSNNSCSLSYQPLLEDFWFSARDAAGLQYRFHNAVYPGSSALGTNWDWASLVDPNADVFNDQYDGRKIYSNEYNSAPLAYMQYRFHGADSYNTQTGGYVMQLLHTKCKRYRGEAKSDTFMNRGRVQFLILPAEQDPNSTPSLAASPGHLPFVNGLVNFNSGSREGFMWIRILNDPNDYVDSVGSYNINISGSVDYGSFTLLVITPLFDILRGKVESLALNTFKTITCYKRDLSDSCVNFFNYIKALLILYVMFLGFRFMLGADIKHEELIKSLLKITILIGLMNGGTFDFFRENIYPIVTRFSDQIISNMSGFSMLSSTNNISNPFMFLDALMSKMFFNPTFLFQLLSTMAMGITGIFYFIIICVCVVIFIIAIFRAMAIYIMAMLATALLVGVAPIFLTFILFERTYYMFENWAKFTFRYMMEPVIVMAGIIILTQLFTLYIDQVLSYSLCWKCALPFRIPFASLLPFPNLQNIPLFCIYWFSPWGLDPVNDPIGLDLAMVVGLAMVAYSAYGYVDFADKIARRLVGGAGGPSSITLGKIMATDAGNKIKDAALLAQDKIAKNMQKPRDGGGANRPPPGPGDGTGGTEDGPSMDSPNGGAGEGMGDLKKGDSSGSDGNSTSLNTSTSGTNTSQSASKIVTSDDGSVTMSSSSSSSTTTGGADGGTTNNNNVNNAGIGASAAGAAATSGSENLKETQEAKAEKVTQERIETQEKDTGDHIEKQQALKTGAGAPAIEQQQKAESAESAASSGGNKTSTARNDTVQGTEGDGGQGVNSQNAAEYESDSIIESSDTDDNKLEKDFKGQNTDSNNPDEDNNK